MERIQATWLRVLVFSAAAVGAATWVDQPVAAERVPEPASFFFEMLGYSETWLTFTPPPTPGDALSALSLNVTLRYRGKPAEGAIASPLLAVVVRAQANPQFRPNVMRQPTFMLYADNEQAWDASLRVDFTPAGAPCEGCSISTDVVQVAIPLDALKRLALAREITGAAFGFPFSLDAAQRDALAAFAARIAE